MYDFDDIKTASTVQKIRAWAIERAIATRSLESDEAIVNAAHTIEQYVLHGKKESTDGPQA